MSRFDLNGKTVVITGASSGIGRAVAMEFAKRGAKVILSARSVKPMEEVAAKVKGQGGEAWVVPADVTKEADMKMLVEKAAELTGQLDVMFCGSGYGLVGRVENICLDLWRQQFEVNFWGVLNCFYAALPVFQKQKSGQYLIMNSGSGRFGIAFWSAYAASKFGLWGFADSARAELKRDNIDVISFYPGFVKTNFHASLVSPDCKFPGDMAATHGGQEPEYVARCIVNASEKRKGQVIFQAGTNFAARFMPISFAFAQMARKQAMKMFISMMQPKS